MDWIPVAYAKPAELQTVIVLDWDGQCWPPCEDDVNCCIYAEGYFWFNYHESAPYYTCTKVDHLVTHWIPLPNLPVTTLNIPTGTL